jgi:hypothetical protein
LALGPDIQTTLARLSGQKKHPYQSKPQVFNLGNGLKIQSSFLNWRDIDRPLMEGNDALSLISYVRGYNNDFQWEEALKELNDWNKKYNVQRSLSDLMSKKYAPTFVEKSLKSNYSGPKTTEKTWHKQEKLLTESFKLSLSFVNSLHNEGYIRSDHRGNLILSSPKIIKKMKDSSKEEQNVLTNTDTDYPDYDFYNNPLINAKDLRKNPYRHTSINQEESHIDAPLTKTLAASLSNSSRKPSNEKEMEEFIEACMEECFKAYYAKNKIPQKEVTMEKIITSEKDMTRLSEVPKDDEPLLNYFRTSIDNLTQDKQSYFVSLNVQKEPFFLPGPQKYLFLTLHPTEALVFKYRHPQYNCIAIPRGDLEKCLTNIKDFLKDFTIHIAPMEEEDKELLLVKLNKLSLGRNIYDNKDNGKSFLKENSTPREINFSIKHSTKEISEDLKKKQNITSTPRFN